MDDPFEVRFIEDLLVFRGAQQKRTATEIVDLAGDALGVVIDAGEKAIGKDGVLRAGHAEVVFDVGDGLLEVKGTEVVTDGNALKEGLIRGKTEKVGQVGLTEQDQGEQGGGVHLVVEEEAELVKDVGREAMGFIENEQEIAGLSRTFGENRG